MWHEYVNAASLDDALRVLSKKGTRARIVAGATDLLLEIERGVRHEIDTLVDLTRVNGLARIVLDEDDVIHLGPLVTHSHLIASKLIVERAYPLARAAIEIGAPQIRNRGTVAGNLITASPANDTITPLMALGAWVTLRSLHGERRVPLNKFYTGVRSTVMQPDEVLVDIAFPVLQAGQRGTFIKLGLRRAQAISLVNAAVLLEFDGNLVKGAAITLGAVAPTIIHAESAEAYLVGKRLTEETISRSAELAIESARPIDDLRSSALYRDEMIRICTLRALRQLEQGREREDFPLRPVLLGGSGDQGRVATLERTIHHDGQTPIISNINGRQFVFRTGYDKTLLRLLREDAGLIGTKEGCAEGECGACEVFLDGMAVMSCLVPASRAHGAHIVTIEGLGNPDHLHPVQKAFIDEGAVQCGYCTPGFVMSGAKLLEELPDATRMEIQQAISGNLCRCTGYYSIVNAIERAALASGSIVQMEG